MNNVELWALAISKSLPCISASKAEELTSDHEDFYEYAAHIVEPLIVNEEAANEYADFIENNSDNWVNWIRQTFGPEWGAIAKTVSEEGY